MCKNAIRGARYGQRPTSAAQHAVRDHPVLPSKSAQEGALRRVGRLYLIPGRESIYFGEVHLLRCDIKSVIKLVQHAGWTYEVIISL